MALVDVVFPLRLGPLTYDVPDALAGGVRPGVVVEAEVRKTTRRGVVLRPSTAAPEGSTVKPIKAALGEVPALSTGMLALISWVAEYYFSTEGEALKTMLPREFFRAARARQSRVLKEAPPEIRAPEAPYGLDEKALASLDEIKENVRKRHYRTYLHHAQSTDAELHFLLEALEAARGAIVLVPDLERAGAVHRLLAGRFGERAALYHGDLSPGKRSAALASIASGSSDIVVGSRSAVFAPLPSVSLIAVTQEESPAYKEQRGVRYGARDTAVMRGYLESATVLLSSVCPSVESYYNSTVGKYVLVGGGPHHRYPRVRVLQGKGKGQLSAKLREMAERKVGGDERVMLVVNRPGYSMLHCEDCGHTEVCPKCNIPLMYFKAEKVLRCGYCGHEAAPPSLCPGCGGHALSPSGAGVERVEEELKALGPVGVERRGGPVLKVLMDSANRLVVGTRVLARRAGPDHPFSMAALLNADSYLYAPDFRAGERAFREFIYTAGKVRPGGEMVVVTRNPKAPLLAHLRRYDFRRFYEGELKARQALGYPPFGRMALLEVDSEFAPEVGRHRDVEVLGPVRSRGRRGKPLWKALFKSADRRALRSAVRGTIARLHGVRFSVDVDPVGM